MAKRGLQFLPQRRATDASPLGASIELGVGDILRMNRERRGQELQSVANQLRIRLAYLEAIEEGRYKDLPGSTYAVGFVRSYGDYLGLDGADIVRRFREEVARIHGRTRLIPPVIAADGSVPPAAMLLLSVVGIGIAYGAWYYLSSSDQAQVPVVQDVPAQMIGAPDAAGSGQPEAQHAPAAGASQDGSGMPSDSAASDSGHSPSNLSTIMAPEPSTEPVMLPPTPAPSTSGSAAPSASAPTVAQPAETPSATATPPATETPPPAAPAVTKPAPTAAQETPAQAPTTDAAAAPAAPATASPPETTTAATTQTPPPATDTAAQPPAAVTPPPAADSTASPPATPPDVPTAGTTEPAPSQTAGTESTIPSAPALPAAPESDAADMTTATVAPTGTRIQINARLDTWIKIVDHNGRTVLNRVLTAGESYDVPDEAGLKMITGNAGGMDILVDGTAIAPLGEPGKVRRDVELDPEKLKAGTAIPQ